MKKLCLIRHAKSSWNHPTLDDAARPLDLRGEQDALEVAKLLDEHGIKADAILTSPAIRAHTTAEIIAKALSYPVEKIVTTKEMYEAGVEDLLGIILQLPQDVNVAFLVGHNPGLSWLANYLVDSHAITLPTCGTFCVEFNTTKWTDILSAETKTVFSGGPHQKFEWGKAS